MDSWLCHCFRWDLPLAKVIGPIRYHGRDAEWYTEFDLAKCEVCGGFLGFPQKNMDMVIRDGGKDELMKYIRQDIG